MDALYDEANRVNLGYDYRSSLGPVKAVRGQAYYTIVRHWMTDEYRLSSQNMSRAYGMGTMARTETLGGKVEATFSRGPPAWRSTTAAGTPPPCSPERSTSRSSRSRTSR